MARQRRFKLTQEELVKMVKLHEEEGLNFTVIGTRFGRNPSHVSMAVRNYIKKREARNGIRNTPEGTI